jgi:hypothetical protein
MKQILVIFLMGFLAIKALGQPSVDLGFFGGAGTYLGDMTNLNFQKSVKPAYGGFIRYNFNPRYGLRFNVINGNIGAEGNFDNSPWSFNKNVLDISLLFEFNYLKFIVGDKLTPWSSFIFFGAGVQTYNYEGSRLDGAYLRNWLKRTRDESCNPLRIGCKIQPQQAIRNWY